MKFQYLESDRLRIRAYDQEVGDFIFDNFANEELKSFLGVSTDVELEKQKKMHTDGFSSYNRSVLMFHLIDRTTNRVIGWCGYHTWYTNHLRAEIGYEFYDEKDMGKGLMSEAMHKVITYGFNNMNLHRIEAFVAPANRASLRILAKFGFIEEGLMREHYRKDGANTDSAVYSLLKHEYTLKFE